MEDEDLTAHLSALGLDANAAAAFHALLRKGQCTPEKLAAHLGWTPRATREAVRDLAALGLAVTGDSADAPITPAEPTLALDHLAHARSADLQRAHLAALNAYRRYRRSTGAQATGDLVEVVTGPRIQDRIRQIEGSAETEVVRFDSPPYHTHGRPNPVEIDSLGRGVEYRVVYSSSSVRNADYYAANIQPCIAAGEQARVLPTVPVKLTVFDRRLAFVSMSSVDAEFNPSLLLVYPSSLLSALLGLFETAWRSAYPMHLSGQIPPVLRPVQRRILELLGSGVTDDTIAQLLGISRRTLSRNLEQLYVRAGAATRFQLAVYACREGWI